jgi:hypothetical protein
MVGCNATGASHPTNVFEASLGIPLKTNGCHGDGFYNWLFARVGFTTMLE